MATDLIGWYCAAHVRNKPFKERAATLAPAFELQNKLQKQLFHDNKFKNEIKQDEYILKLFLDPYSMIEPIVDEIEYIEPNCSIMEARKKFIDILSLLLSDNYKIVERSQDLWKIEFIDLYQQLIIIGVFYSSISSLNTVPQNILLRIDHIMAQLAFGVANYICLIHAASAKDYRIIQGKSKKAKTKSERKQPVLEEFYRIDITGMSKRKIASTIEENLDKQQRDVPSRKTIQRYLEKENLI